ncbi:MAG: bifunctional tetrahydrofolate synthase/dihydrofolate synthase [Pseudomonadota bacterium]|jgi:dihydrofolate synthase / folylpolyglutamate synthase
MQSLDDWLAHAERLHPQVIDLGLDRVRAVSDRLGLKLSCTVFTVAGTNGKGSTCAMLESILQQAGYRTAVYSSPHLVHFEERLRIGGQSAAAADLAASCALVEQARSQPGSAISLTYFEFTTLAILHRIDQAGVDAAILEVGLGGRLDAVNIVDTDCAILTSIDLDHTALLGPTREAIGCEKAGIMRPGRPAIVSDPLPPQSVLDHAAQLGADVWQHGRDFSFEGDRQQWGWVSSVARGARRYAGLAYPALRGANQLVNAAGVLAALTALRERLPVSAQAVRIGLATVQLPGRFQTVPGQPALVLDVAHNPHAVSALVANLDAMGFYPRTHAVFGGMADKDLQQVLLRAAPLVDAWYFTDLPTPRAETARRLLSILEQVNQINKRSSVSAKAYDSPVLALEAARAAADPADRIVVFGSFVTVGAVLQHGVPAS